MTPAQLANRRARETRTRDALRDGRAEMRLARRRGMHLRVEGMVTVCGVRLDSPMAKAARFTDDAATLRRTAAVCEVCAREARR